MSKKIEPGMAYDTAKLNKVFAFLSILFLATVVWVFLDDYLRPWKAVQVEALKIKRQKIDEKLKLAEQEIDLAKLSALEAELSKGEEIVSQRRTEIGKIKKELADVDRLAKAETIVNGTLNSLVSATTFQYEMAHAEHKPNAHDLFVKLRDLKGKFAESKDRVKAIEARGKAAASVLANLEKELKDAEDSISKLTSTRDLLKAAKKQTDMNGIFVVRNSPFVDFLDPTLKIRQVVMEHITDDRYFQHVPKVDRCMTCHTFIDQAGYEDQPQPFKTHPNLDLMVGIDSPHPMKSYGCTSCHEGEGHRVNNFSSPEHRPRNDVQKEEWIAKYHYHEGHKIAKPMLKLQYTEASCVKCHQGVEYIPGATVLNEGRKGIEEFGCYACHKIEGWEHKRKPGPSLEKIASKISSEFFKNWVWDPKSFNAHTKMPSFFNQVNNSKPEFMKKNITEVNAMAEYIWSKSKDYAPNERYRGGNIEKGKELISTVGCMGCHGVEGFEEASEKVGAYAGPYLTGTGSKVSGDWLVSWLKKPSHFQADTIMPSFRLTDTEANDIASYLLSLRNKRFEGYKFEPLDTKIRDEILIDYLAAFETVASAEAKVAAMSDHQKTIELGYRSVGKYGCFSCHNVEGFDGRAPIGPELTKVGSKPITQFGFGHEHDVEHSRDGWIKAHLINPRRWDKGTDKPFKDLNLMPNFDMSDKKAEQITLALLGQVADYIPLAGVKRLNEYEKVAADGMKVVNKFNCVGCHQIDGERGDILKMYDDPNEAPPVLNGQGHRVQADWFHHFLTDVSPIRPWLKVRMPSFNLSNGDKNKIVAMFQAKSKQQTFEENKTQVVWEPGEKQAAKQLFDSLNCVSCHTTGFNRDEPTAPDLHKAAKRLRPSWIEKWLRNPQAVMPDTVMPNFWDGGVALDQDVFGGDTDKQIQALTKFILELGEKNASK
jgi:mono/diheme cytochrome c family protein